MRRFGLTLAMAFLPALAGAGGQDMWTWTDGSGVVHYTNVAEFAPTDAKAVGSRVTVEVDRIPSEGEAAATSAEKGYDPFPADRRHRFPVTDLDAYGQMPVDGGNEFTNRDPSTRLEDSFGEQLGRYPYAEGWRFEPLPDAPRVYDDARLKFGCYTGGVLWAGGFSHANDISGVQNCYPYRLGPEAWLNAARAELAMRQNGINPRDMMKLYMEERGGL